MSRPCGSAAGDAGPSDVKADAEQAPEASGSEPQGPRVIWEGRTLHSNFEDAETKLYSAVAGSVGGFGLALLGLAPHLSPGQMWGPLLLSALQLQLGNLWQKRMLRAQLRRNVTEISLDVSGDAPDTQKVVIKQDGGVQRQITLKPPAVGEPKPPFAKVLKSSEVFVFIDREQGEVHDAESLESLLASESVVAAETCDVETMSDEGQAEAQQVVQKLAGLTHSHLDRFAKSVNSKPGAAIDEMVKSSRVIASVIVLGGAAICVAGRADS